MVLKENIYNEKRANFNENKINVFRKISELFDVSAKDVISTIEKDGLSIIKKKKEDKNFLLNQDRQIKNLDVTYSKNFEIEKFKKKYSKKKKKKQ